MSSHVLALKYRPQNFDDVVGQPTAVQILKNILKGQKIHHAYLLNGPRGIGKTSLARIFAKALNCEKGEKPTDSPCGVCISCQEITEGRSLSVMEIDGASNTSVDDVRDLREKIRYLPPGGRFKIYIIDEVHMLSTAAFNALLKTLEEPPSHAIFIFATTEPQKLPITIISRCLRFDLKPISLAEIVGCLQEVAKKESIVADEVSLYAIAREATGGLRDALSLLDQAAAFSDKKISLPVLEEILGASPHRFLMEIVSSILNKEPASLLAQIRKAMEAGIDPKRLVTELLQTIRDLLVVSVTDSPALFDLPPDEIQRLKKLSETVSEGSLDQIFRILEREIPTLLRSPNPQILLDVLLLRLCHYQELETLQSILEKLEGRPTVKAPTEIQQTRPAPMVPQQKGWKEFLTQLKTKKPQLASIVEHAASTELNNTELALWFNAGSIHLEMLRDDDRQDQLREALQGFLEKPVTIRLSEVSSSMASNQPSHVLKEAISIFQPRSTKTVTSP